MRQEVYVFLSAMVCGAAAGFIYDLFRLKRKAIKTRPLLVSLEDIVFWLLTTLLVFVAAYFSNKGELRLYFFFAAFLGVVVYYWLFSRWVTQILTFLVKVLIWPFLFLAKLLKPPVQWVSRILGEQTVKTKKKLQLSRLRINRRLKSIRHIYRKV